MGILAVGFEIRAAGMRCLSMFFATATRQIFPVSSGLSFYFVILHLREEVLEVGKGTR